MHLQDFAGDDHALNLACAFADGAELHVAIELFCRIVFDEAVAAEQMHFLIADTHGHLARKELCH